MAAGGAALADGFQFTELAIFHNEVICCLFDRINRHRGQCAQHMHVFILRITSPTAQTG